MIVEALLVLATALAIAYIILYFTGPGTTFEGEKALYNLNQKSPITVLPATFLPWDNRPCALRFGIMITSAPRTIAKVDCITISQTPEQTTFAPNCENYEYNKCKCLTTDCTSCDIPANSYLSKLLSISNRLELWASGYIHERDKPYVPALLKVYTQKDETNNYMESIPLPTIPLQKWTIITIVKQGRRFDIYYGQELVASKITEFVPRSPEGNRQWIAGHPKWQGQIGFFKGFIQPYTKNDVQKDVSSLVNTRGIPFYIDQAPLDFSTVDLSLPSCPLGNCNPMPEVKLRNPFVIYDANYS